MAAPGEYRTAAVVGAESWNKSFIDDRFCQCTDVFMMIGGGEEGGQHVGTECADLTRYDRLDAAPACTRPNFAGGRSRPQTGTCLASCRLQDTKLRLVLRQRLS